MMSQKPSSKCSEKPVHMNFSFWMDLGVDFPHLNSLPVEDFGQSQHVVTSLGPTPFCYPLVYSTVQTARDSLMPAQANLTRQRPDYSSNLAPPKICAL